ncbi:MULTISPECIES: SHOCT domain-containing protein [Cytophagales]|jgi:putative membrane protein|uniref:SHOCT domain-containing protein n=2 Tax=Cytophagales TaxID=768507 RepID=A0A937DF73_9BACT|nr:SHOCT domain-containing protein [Marivirga atlantica]MBL0765932.1 SHOCT domain-containing protein [Marivirga atlantica]MBV6639684.1 SHOCT domain-containing protein [Cyclobacteriaceae bacterium SS2]
MMHDWYFGGMHWIWWILWLILLCWIFLIPYPTPGQNRRKDKAMEALRERYARGEISDEEFEQKKKVLQDKKK